MIYREIPGTDIRASVVGFGLWGVSGQWEGGKDDAQAVRTIETAVEKGVNFFDTAPVYGLGHSETVLGKALEGKRDQVFIASKCGLVWDGQNNVTVDLSAASVKREIDEILTRLKTDYIDLWQIHWPNPAFDLEETLEAMCEVRESGKVRYLGVTNFSAADTRLAKEKAGIVSWQGLYNMLERNPSSYHSIDLAYRTEREILPLAEELGLGILPYSPLMQGLLTGKFTDGPSWGKDDVRSANPRLSGEASAPYWEMARALAEFSRSCGVPMARLAFGWMIAKSPVSSVIAGARTPEQIASNAEAGEAELSADLLAGLEEVLQPWESTLNS